MERRACLWKFIENDKKRRSEHKQNHKDEPITTSAKMPPMTIHGGPKLSSVAPITIETIDKKSETQSLNVTRNAQRFLESNKI